VSVEIAPFVPADPDVIERMARLRQIHRDKVARGESVPAGRKKKPTKVEARREALKDLTPKALLALEQDLEQDKDRSLRQKAAFKILEYDWGKPTQPIQVDHTPIVVFHTAALPDDDDWKMLDAGEEIVDGEAVEVE
jgi:hypothetical protein